MSDPVTVVADGLTKFWLECDNPFTSRRNEAKAILAALKAAGYTIVSPATKTYDPSPSLTVRWADGQVVVHAEGCGVVRTLLDDNRHTPDAARELGAALLAAAERAEADR